MIRILVLYKLSKRDNIEQMWRSAFEEARIDEKNMIYNMLRVYLVISSGHLKYSMVLKKQLETLISLRKK